MSNDASTNQKNLLCFFRPDLQENQGIAKSVGFLLFGYISEN